MEPYTPAAFVAFCAFWRFWDGLDKSDSHIVTGVRNTVTVALCLGAAYYATRSPWALWIGGWSALSLIDGKTDWSDWGWQSLRFALFAALAVLPLNAFGHTWPYLVACSLVGLSYPALQAVDRWLPRWWLFDGFEAYARLPLGAGVIGGLVFL